MSGYAITLRYGGSSQAFTVQGLTGFDDVDEIGFVVGMDGKGLDGTHPQSILAFQRIVTIDFGVILDKTLRTWLAAFALSNDQHVIYATEDMPVVLETPNAIADIFVDGFQNARQYIWKFIEAIPRRGLPISWGANPWVRWGQTDITPFADISYTFASLP